MSDNFDPMMGIRRTDPRRRSPLLAHHTLAPHGSWTRSALGLKANLTRCHSIASASGVAAGSNVLACRTLRTPDLENGEYCTMGKVLWYTAIAVDNPKISEFRH